mmetsp:Transcript_70687/g.197513  ORF Transcript_70687/g.197513 Transcript_70687/m.197513 type:complete len:233 (+) Transcript_70687:868-1566(+)
MPRRYLPLQVLSGLVYLHSQRILHRDIKGDNILLDEEGVVKLADFGVSKRLNERGQLVESTKGVVGTPYFMAPEVMGQQHYGPTADVWSVGCVALQMATGQPPWRGLGFKSPMQLYEFVKSNPKTIPNLPHGASEVSRTQPISTDFLAAPSSLTSSLNILFPRSSATSSAAASTVTTWAGPLPASCSRTRSCETRSIRPRLAMSSTRSSRGSIPTVARHLGWAGWIRRRTGS